MKIDMLIGPVTEQIIRDYYENLGFTVSDIEITEQRVSCVITPANGIKYIVAEIMIDPQEEK